MLINVADCGPYSIEGREIFKGALLTEKEARSVLTNACDGLAFAASAIVRSLPYRRRKEAATAGAKRKAPPNSKAKAKGAPAANTDIKS